MRWVAAQFALIAAIVLGWLLSPHPGYALVGAVLALLGAALAGWAAVSLGPALTPFPEPRGPRVVHGAYAHLRHPMYVGATVFLVGMSLWLSWVSLALTACLAVLWRAKARVEDRLLAARFPEER